MKEQLRLVDVVLDVRAPPPQCKQGVAAVTWSSDATAPLRHTQVRDARIPLSTGHPSVASWTGGKLRLVVLNQMDRVSDNERARWTAYFQTAANTRVVFTNARTGDGVQRLARLALSVSEGVNQRRAEKGLRPRPVRAAVVGFPNVGKSALINRLLGRAQCASAQRPGVTRHLQWVSLGPEGSLMLLDAPGVLPMRLADQHAAIRLAICNDIGEASYTTSLVAAQFVELLRKHPTQGRQRMASLEQRYRISAAGLTGEDYILAMAEKHCGGEVERAGRKLLKDYQEGKLGTFGLDVVPPYESSGAERDAHRAPPPPQQQQVGTVWQPDGPSRRVVKEAEKAARRGDVMPSSL